MAGLNTETFDQLNDERQRNLETQQTLEQVVDLSIANQFLRPVARFTSLMLGINGDRYDEEIATQVTQILRQYRTQFATNPQGSSLSANFDLHQQLLSLATRSDLHENVRLQFTHDLLQTTTQSIADLEQNNQQTHALLTNYHSQLVIQQAVNAEQQQDITRQLQVITQLQSATQAIDSSLQQVKTQLSATQHNDQLQYQALDQLQHGMASLTQVVKQHELRLHDVEVMSRAVFVKLSEVDVKGYSQLSTAIAQLDEAHQRLLHNPQATVAQIQASEQALRAKVALFDQDVMKLKQTTQLVSGVTGFIDMLAPVVGVPELKKISAIIKGGYQIYQGVSALVSGGAKAAAIGAKAAGMAMALSAATVIGAGIAVVAMAFMSSGSDNSSQAIIDALVQISKQIEALAEQVAELREFVDYRFDRLEEQLNANFLAQQRISTFRFETLVELLDDLHRDVLKQFIITRGGLAGLQHIANTLQTRLDRLSRSTENGFRHLYRQRFDDAIQLFSYYDNQRYDSVSALTEREVRDGMRLATTWSAVDAANPIFHGDLAQDYTLAAVSATVNGEVLSYVNLLWLTLRSQQGLQLPVTLHALPANFTAPLPASLMCKTSNRLGRLINPQVWQEAVDWFLHFQAQTPELQFQDQDKCFAQEMMMAAKEYLQVVMSLKVHPHLFTTLIDGYQSAAEAMIFAFYVHMLEQLEVLPSQLRQQQAEYEAKLTTFIRTIEQLDEKTKRLENYYSEFESFLVNSCVIGNYRAETVWMPTQFDCYETKAIGFTLSPATIYKNYSHPGSKMTMNIDYKDQQDCHADNHIEYIRSTLDIISILNNIVEEMSSTLTRITSVAFSEQLRAVSTTENAISISSIIVALNNFTRQKIDNTSIVLVEKCTNFHIYPLAAAYDPTLLFLNGKENLMQEFSQHLNRIKADFSNAQVTDIIYKNEKAYNELLTKSEQYKQDLSTAINLQIKQRLNTTTTPASPLLPLINQWLLNNATRTQCQEITSSFNHFLNSASAQRLSQELEHYYRALHYYAQWIYNEEYSSDITLQRLLQQLPSATQFKALLQQLDVDVPAHSGWLNVSTVLYSNDNSNATLVSLRNYMHEAIARGQQLQAAGNLSTGYEDMNTRLAQLMVLRDGFMTTLSPTQTTPITPTTYSSSTRRSNAKTPSPSRQAQTETTVDAAVKTTPVNPTTSPHSTRADSTAENRRSSTHARTVSTSAVPQTTVSSQADDKDGQFNLPSNIVLLTGIASGTLLLITSLCVYAYVHRQGRTRVERLQGENNEFIRLDNIANTNGQGPQLPPAHHENNWVEGNAALNNAMVRNPAFIAALYAYLIGEIEAMMPEQQGHLTLSLPTTLTDSKAPASLASNDTLSNSAVMLQGGTPYRETLTGQWDQAITIDPKTGSPIFTYHAVDAMGQERGSVQFYQQPRLCRSVTGERNNLINSSGVFNELEIDNRRVTNICEQLPPTQVENAIASAKQGAMHGVISGASNAVHDVMREQGFNATCSQLAQYGTYYSSYFAWKMAEHQQHSASQASWYESSVVAFWQTLWVMSINIGLKMLQVILHSCSEWFSAQHMTKTADIVNKLSNAVPLATFFVQAKTQGLTDTLSATAAGFFSGQGVRAAVQAVGISSPASQQDKAATAAKMH